MSRNGAGVYSLPAGSTVANGDVSDAADLNTPLADLEADMNIPRPVVAGGTGASTAADARTNLGLAIGTNVLAYDAGVQQIADLADPNADRILFWDDSAGAYTYLTVGSNLSISGTTLNGADQTPADGSITFAKLAGAAVITSGETLLSNDNDTSIPTSAAVLDAIGAILIVRDQKTSATSGGTFTSGSWQTRTLNTTIVNNISGASIGSNQITLPAGTYLIRASAPAHRVNAHQTRLQDITNGATLLNGSSEYTEQAGAIVVTRSQIDGTFTLSGTSALQIQHQCQTTRSTDGFGLACSFTTEIYTAVEIQRLA